MKCTPLNSSAVYPTRLQLQNVKHVLNVFNDRVIAALQLEGKVETAAFIQDVLSWWKIVNVSAKSENVRFNDQDRVVQTPSCSNLSKYIQLFTHSTSGQGPKRVHSLTHDTRKALIQTTEGLQAVCNFLYAEGMEYVCLKDMQSDKIESEFGIYRQSTGSNFFMTADDAISCFKKRLTRFSAVVLKQVDSQEPKPQHTCKAITCDEAMAIEASSITLTKYEEFSLAYVGGWLEFKCKDLNFAEEDFLLSDLSSTSTLTDFITEVSRGKLKVPHQSVYDFLKAGLCFLKKYKKGVCCRKQMMEILAIMNNYFQFGSFQLNFLKRMSNVLLNGLHKMEKDSQHSSYAQAALKKARLS